MFKQDYKNLIIEFEKFDKTILHHFIKWINLFWIAYIGIYNF
jgi:hypothetical protein